MMYLFKSEDHSNRLLYAYYKNEFWFFDPHAHQWFISGHVREQYELEAQKDVSLTPDDFTCTGYGYEFVAEYEVPVSVLDALRTAKKILPKEDEPCKSEPVAPTGAAAATTDASAAPMPSTAAETSTTSESGAGAVTSTRRLSGSIGPSTSPAPASRADAGAATQSLSAAGPASLEAPPSGSSAFDYTELDDQTVAVLHLAEREIREARQTYICRVSAAVAAAHDSLCGTDATICRNGDGTFSAPEKTFGAWCASVGLSRKTAERLLQVNNLLTGATAAEQATLEAASPSLLYAAAKPSAPAELVQAVKAGDITTHKQYQELLAKLKAAQSDKAAAESMKDSALETLRQAQADAAQANDKVRAAENRAAGAQKLADQRATENAELKAKLRALESRPVEVAVTQPGAEQIEAWRKEGEARILSRAKDLAGKARQAQQQAECHASDLEEENNRLRDALNRTRQLDQSAAMACGTCSAALEAWFETTARDVPADLGPALTRMKRLRLALDIAIENGVWPDAAALDDLEAQDDDG